MGDLNIRLISNQKELNTVTSHLLKDVKALEIMLNEGWFSENNFLNIIDSLLKIIVQKS